MTTLEFTKYHGLGNDFIILDSKKTGDLVTADVARRLCDRHRGIGADGVLTILPADSEAVDARLHIWNADGSVAQMCGNGLRCVVAFLNAGKLIFATDAGIRSGELFADGSVKVSVGIPKSSGELLELTVLDRAFKGMQVDMGNPHYVIEAFEPEVDLLAMAEKYGHALEHHEAFLDRSNIEFVSVQNNTATVVVHERGVGITQACGTGAGATYVALKQCGQINSEEPVEIALLGGALRVKQEAREIFIQGEAVKVFEGSVTI